MSASRLFTGVFLLGIGLLISACTRFLDAPVTATIAPTSTTLATSRQPTATIPPVVLAPEGRRATVSEVVNKVEAQTSAQGAFQVVQDGTLIGLGGQVRTSAGARARVDLGSAAIIRLDADSLLSVRSLGDSNGKPLNLVALNQGRIWVTVNQGTLQVVTPIGIASVHGSFAVLSFNPGAPNDLADDVMTFDCLEGSCALQTKLGDVTATNLERLVLNQGNNEVKHQPLAAADVQDFLKNNPDSGQLVSVALTEQSGAEPTATAVPQAAASPTASPTASGPTAVPILGKHTVRAGESLFCIGRAYGVLPGAIAEANGLDLNSRINPNQDLVIPAVRWVNIPGGPVCAQQFNSPFPAGDVAPIPPTQVYFYPTSVFNPPVDTPVATDLPTLVPTLAATAFPVCPTPQLYDPAMDRCRILQP